MAACPALTAANSSTFYFLEILGLCFVERVFGISFVDLRPLRFWSSDLQPNWRCSYMVRSFRFIYIFESQTSLLGLFFSASTFHFYKSTCPATCPATTFVDPSSSLSTFTSGTDGSFLFTSSN